MHTNQPPPPPTHVHLRWSTETGTVIATFEFAEFCEAASTRFPALFGPAFMAKTRPEFFRALFASLLMTAAVTLLRDADGLDALHRGVNHP